MRPLRSLADSVRCCSRRRCRHAGRRLAPRRVGRAGRSNRPCSCRTRRGRSSSAFWAISVPATARSTSWPIRWARCTTDSSTASSSWSATTCTAPNGRRTSRRSSRSLYKKLLDAGVKFYASLGNHDAREQRYYKPFNMDGNLYYTFSPKAEVRFFALESTYLVPGAGGLAREGAEVIRQPLEDRVLPPPAVFVRRAPRIGHQTARGARAALLRYNVSVVLQGHDHFYERVKPQNDIPYFVVGSGGKLRSGNIDRGSGITAKGFDTDLAFMAAEIDGDQMYFNVISRARADVDSGVITRREAAHRTETHVRAVRGTAPTKDHFPARRSSSKKLKTKTGSAAAARHQAVSRSRSGRRRDGHRRSDDGLMGVIKPGNHRRGRSARNDSPSASYSAIMMPSDR